MHFYRNLPSAGRTSFGQDERGVVSTASHKDDAEVGGPDSLWEAQHSHSHPSRPQEQGAFSDWPLEGRYRAVKPEYRRIVTNVAGKHLCPCRKVDRKRHLWLTDDSPSFRLASEKSEHYPIRKRILRSSESLACAKPSPLLLPRSRCPMAASYKRKLQWPASRILPQTHQLCWCLPS